ncbi:hypothetical protein FRC03_003412 [Tulasnella sp. 419]|nr:hypothetical protein FRC03_003412 [Tulasnella sp. 419]
MVDTRLLDHLNRADKDFTQAFGDLFVLSHASIAALSAYGSSTAPPTSQAIMGVTTVLISVDQALRTYVASIDDWREKVKEIKRIDTEISHIMRDREILVTRLLKASKQKPNRDSLLHPTGPPSPSMSNQSLSIAKLTLAQQELQACEMTLSQKQAELDEITRSAVKDGLEKRCRALIDCGYTFSEKGREGLIALDILRPSSPSRPHTQANGHASPYVHHPVPRPFLPNGYDAGSTSSLAPSQSASNVAQNAVQNDEPQVDKPRTPREVNAPLPPVPQSVNPPVPSEARPMSPYKLDIRPAHSIEDHVYPSGHPIEDEDQQEVGLNSSDEDDRPLEVHENPPRAGTPAVIPPPQPATVEVIAQPSTVRRKLSQRSGKGKGKAKDPSENPPAPVQPLATNGHSKPLTIKAPPHTHNHLHKPMHSASTAKHKRDFSSSTNQSSTYQPSSNDSPRKRSGSFFNGIAGLFHRGTSSHKNTASDSSPPPSPLTRTRKASDSRDGGWSTRTNRNIKAAREDARNGGYSSSEDEKKKIKSGTLVEVKNNKPADANGSGPFGSLRKPRQGAVSRFGMKRSATGPPIKEEEKVANTKRSSSLERGSVTNQEATVVRRLSKHSSDGALKSKATPAPEPATNSATKDETPNSPTQTTTAHRDGPAKIRKRSKSRSGAKKNFADGLGMAGGALVIGGSESNAQAAAEQTTPLGHTVTVSRSSTVRSADTTTTTNSDFVGKPTSMEVVGHGAGGSADPKNKTGNTPLRRSSLQYEVKPDVLAAARPASPQLQAKRTTGKSKTTTNNLMSIVAGVSSANTNTMPKLEIVRAPPSITATPILFNPPPPLSNGTPRNSMDTPGAGPSKINSSSAAVFAPKLVLPSTVDKPVVVPAPALMMETEGAGPSSSGSKAATAVDQERRDLHHHVPVPSALSPAPLRSALRTRSPSPAIQPQPSAPAPIPAREPSPPLPAPPVPTKREMTRPPAPKSHRMSVDSVSSYETGHEDFDEEEPEPQHGFTIPHPNPGTTSNALAQHIAASLEGKEKKGTDLSLSTDSTSVPKRQKSVRMALPPSVSSTPASTPAAFNEAEAPQDWPADNPGARGASRRPAQQDWNSRIGRNGVKDVWEDDSDDDADYGRARKALMKATRAFEHAGDLEPKKKKNATGATRS